MEDRDSQSDEINALQSIFSEEEFKSSCENGVYEGQFYVFFTFPDGYKVVIENDKDVNREGIIFNIHFLPPIEIVFILPPDYPSRAPPCFTISCPWLTKESLLKLCEKMDQLWEENKGSEILYNWAEFLKKESISFLGIVDKLEINLTKIENERKQGTNDSETPHESNFKIVKSLSSNNLNNAIRTENVDIYTNISSTSILNSDNCGRECAQENSGLTNKEDTVDNLESKRLFEKNKKCPKNCSDNNGEESTYNIPGKIYETNQSINELLCRGTNIMITEGHTNDVHLGKTGQEMEKIRANLNMNEEKDFDEVQKNSELKIAVSVENSAVEKRVKHHIGQYYNENVPLFLQSYDEDRAKIEFLRNIYPCNICFQDKPGVKSTQFLPCKHVFCRECVSGYFETCIRDGTVNSIRCPEDKCSSEATPSQIKDIVSPELFVRYDSMLLSATLETMKDIVFCPRSFCQYPTTKEEGSKMARCPACNYAFCVYCKMVYHGMELCRYKEAERLKICEDYRFGDEEMKLYMEQKYGKKHLTMLLNMALSEEWIDGNSKRCPCCNSAIEKIGGCNKMMCVKCNTFFCYLCKAKLDQVNPYAHFDDSLSPCFKKLHRN